MNRDIEMQNGMLGMVHRRAGRRRTWLRAVVLGTAAGLGAIVLPERLGLGTPPHSHRRTNGLMTVGWYVAGAAAAGRERHRQRDAKPVRPQVFTVPASAT